LVEGAAGDSLVCPLSRPDFFLGTEVDFLLTDEEFGLAEDRLEARGGVGLALEVLVTMVDEGGEIGEAREAAAKVKKVWVWRWRSVALEQLRNSVFHASSHSWRHGRLSLEVEDPIGQRSVEIWLVGRLPWLEFGRRGFLMELMAGACGNVGNGHVAEAL
jgi:hypothetical protein